MKTKYAEIVICGAPNVGKSTIVNTICGRKVSIVSPKVQTTRQSILGVFTEGDTQIAFVDTPGVFRARSGFIMERQITRAAWAEIRSAEHILLVVDAKRGICQSTLDIISDLKERQLSGITVVMNKIDLVNTAQKIELAQKLYDVGIFSEIYMISNVTRAGMEKFIGYIKTFAADGEFMYDTSGNVQDKEFYATEITREKIFTLLNQELPYVAEIKTESFEESDEEIVLSQVVSVPKESHRKIVVGKNGAMIKQIGVEAIEEMESAFKKTVKLSLYCNVVCS